MDKTTKKRIRKAQYQDDPSVIIDELGDQMEELGATIQKSLEVVQENKPIIYQLKTVQGDKGEKGEKGDKGDKGEDGLNGEDGYSPIKGKDYDDGQPGEPGYTPIKGKDYFTSEEIREFKKEVTPIKGKDYKDGEPGEVPKLEDLIDQVIDKIKKLKGNDRLDISNLRNGENLAYLLSKPKKNDKIDFNDMRWHGSGLTASGIYTQTPVGLVNGINTVYTVDHEINNVIGFAINGQYIHPSEYSFSGTTITFFTPIDASLAGTPFSITYV